MQQLEEWKVSDLVEYARNPRKNDHAVDKVAAAIREFGFRVPILAKSDKTIVDGHLRLKAAKKLGLEDVPVMLCDDMTDAQIRAFRISVNRVAEFAEWDYEMLKIELGDLESMDFDLSILGFDDEETFKLLGDGLDESKQPSEDEYKEVYEVVVSCCDESEQEAIFQMMTAKGLKCRVLSM